MGRSWRSSTVAGAAGPWQVSPRDRIGSGGRQNYTVLFTTAQALVAALVKAHGEGRLEERLAFLAKPKLLIVDELGYLPFDPNELFFQLVSRRYERGAMLITSNRSVGEWRTVFGDPIVATAILDRLLHHSHVMTIQLPATRKATNM